MADSDLLNAHVARLLKAAAPGTEPADEDAAEQRRMVELYVVERMDWRGIAAAMGLSSGTLKVRFTRLRPRLVEAVYAEFIRSLPAESGPLARALLVDGRHTADAAQQMGITEEQARHLMMSVILPAMREHFGPSFLGLLPRIQRHRPASGR